MPFRLLILLVLAAATAPAQVNFVGGVWAGNVSPTSATVAVRLNTPAIRVRVLFSLTPTLTAPIFSAAANTPAGSHTVKLTVQGLQPDTDYYYGVEVANVIRTDELSRGRLRTFPLGRGSFKIAFGSCGDYRHPDQSAYDAILRERPLLFIHTGDFHYNDTNTTNADEYRFNYDNVLSQRNQGALYRGVPIAYMWDDHDYCGDNTDTTAVGRNTARAVYRERVPHYPLGPSDGTIGQAFTIGRVRVLMTDLRSGAQAISLRESATKTRMGVAQKAWFKQELIAARDSGAPMILWVCPDPWIGRAALTEDTWGGHATERTEIANFIRDNRISNVVIVAGDMHALAFDDGVNSDYATGGGAPLTVLHGAALTQGGSIKGGPYGGGVVPGSAQWGMLEVYDSGGPGVACRFLGMRAGEGVKLTHIFSSSPIGTGDHALVNISTLARIASGTDSLISGFVISGTAPRNVLVRAIGPTLGAFGVNDALTHPALAVFQGDRLLATNSQWNSGAEALVRLTAAFDQVGAFRLIDESSTDAAVVLPVAPGAYTVQVRSGNGAPGSVLLEVYDLP
jgi:phosphodiesterase/alkaline phosphatase D-like protein